MNRERKNKRRRELYRERLEAGLCVQCGARLPVEGFTKCDPCWEKATEASTRFQLNHKAS